LNHTTAVQPRRPLNLHLELGVFRKARRRSASGIPEMDTQQTRISVDSAWFNQRSIRASFGSKNLRLAVLTRLPDEPINALRIG
jgi:hypothetical protein